MLKNKILWENFHDPTIIPMIRYKGNIFEVDRTFNSTKFMKFFPQGFVVYSESLHVWTIVLWWF